MNIDHVTPATNSAADLAAATRANATLKRWYIEAITRQTYRPEALAALGPHLPKHWQDDMKTIGQPLDFLGVNYYARHHFADDPGQLWPATEPIAGPVAKASMGWEIYPQGLTDVLAELSRDHIGQTPVYIAENGMAPMTG